jgi:hypothetical protein
VGGWVGGWLGVGLCWALCELYVRALCMQELLDSYADCADSAAVVEAQRRWMESPPVADDRDNVKFRSRRFGPSHLRAVSWSACDANAMLCTGGRTSGNSATVEQ